MSLCPRILKRAKKNDESAATQATIKFSEKISKITRDGFQELGVIESETNSLRLTASDEVAAQSQAEIMRVGNLAKSKAAELR